VVVDNVGWGAGCFGGPSVLEIKDGQFLLPDGLPLLPAPFDHGGAMASRFNRTGQLLRNLASEGVGACQSLSMTA
jgi:hypothetical protein